MRGASSSSAEDHRYARVPVAVVLATCLVLCLGLAYGGDDEKPDVELGGFIQFDAIRDLDAIGNPDKFTTRTIPTAGSQTSASAAP